MGKITKSKHEYDEMAKEYFAAEGFFVKIHGTGAYPDLTATKDGFTAVVEVKGPEEKGADEKYTYENKIGDMTRQEIADLLNDNIDRKSIRGLTSLMKLYFFGIVSELYNYYKIERIKHPEMNHQVEAFFCIPNQYKNIIAINVALILLKIIGFILPNSSLHSEFKKIRIFKIYFNDKIKKEEAQRNAKQKKNEIKREVEKELQKYKKEIRLPFSSPKSYIKTLLSAIQSIASAIGTFFAVIFQSIASAIGTFFAVIFNPITLKVIAVIAAIAGVIALIILIIWLLEGKKFAVQMDQETITPHITSPIEQQSQIIKEQPKITRILFGFDSAEINELEKEKLNELIEDLTNVSDKVIIIEGHTCDLGSYEYNKSLSLKRAGVVKSYLNKNKIEIEAEIIGCSFEKPIADNKTAIGRAQNRRVEIILK